MADSTSSTQHSVLTRADVMMTRFLALPEYPVARVSCSCEDPAHAAMASCAPANDNHHHRSEP